MVVFLIIVAVLIGVAYADYCLIDNTAHFGMSLGRAAEAELARKAESLPAAEAVAGEINAPVAEAVVAPAPDPAAVDEALPLPERAAFPARPDRARRRERGNFVPPPRRPAPTWHLLALAPVLELHEEPEHAAG